MTTSKTRFKLYESSKGVLILGREYRSGNGEKLIDGFPLNDPNKRNYRFSKWDGWKRKFFKESNRSFIVNMKRKWIQPYYDFALSDGERFYFHNRGSKVWVVDMKTGFMTNIPFNDFKDIEKGKLKTQDLIFKNK